MTIDLAKLRAETLALTKGATPGTWIFYADLPSVEPDWHIVTTENRLRVLANVHIEPGNVADNANARLIAAAPTLAADTLRLLDEIERLRAENETAVRRSAEWMRNRIAELARQTAANIIAESAGGPRHRRGYEAGRAEAFEIMARTILAVPLPANGAALPEGGPDDR